MALTEEHQFQLELERVRHANILEAEAKRARLEAVRLAKETLIEAARNKPIGEGAVTAEEIIAFASTLTAHVDA